MTISNQKRSNKNLKITFEHKNGKLHPENKQFTDTLSHIVNLHEIILMTL